MKQEPCQGKEMPQVLSLVRRCSDESCAYFALQRRISSTLAGNENTLVCNWGRRLSLPVLSWRLRPSHRSVSAFPCPFERIMLDGVLRPLGFLFAPVVGKQWSSSEKSTSYSATDWRMWSIVAGPAAPRPSEQSKTV